jgi:signal transduction histidine kinase
MSNLMPSETPDPRLLEALASLNDIGATVNQIGLNGPISVGSTLSLIVQSAIKVVPGASAVIYAYDSIQDRFIPSSRVSAGPLDRTELDDEPRQDGLGLRAIAQRRRVLSYEEPDLQIHPVMARIGALVLGAFPLIVSDQPVGALYVFLEEDRSFSTLELLMLDNFVNQAAMAIYHAHNLASMQHDLSRKEEELIRLRKAGLLISSRLSLQETLESILQMALEVTGAHYGIFRLLDKTGQFLTTGAVAGDQLTQPLIETLPLESNSVMAWVARSRQPACIPDLREPPWSAIYYPLDADLEMRSELAVPLIGASGRLEGVLNLESPQIGAFDDSDSYLLQALASQAVITIQEVSLLDALQQITHRLLNEPCQSVLKYLADLASDLLQASDSLIWIVNGNDLVLESLYSGYAHNIKIPLQNSLAGQTFQSRTPLFSADLHAEIPLYPSDLSHAREWTRALFVPLLPGDGTTPLGVFAIYSNASGPGHFAETEWDKKVLITLADYAVLALQNAARQEALKVSQEQRSVAETFAAVGDLASNLLHQLNNKVGTIPVRIQGIEDKCSAALAENAYLSHNLDEIERCAIEAMESVRENLSKLRPIRLEPTSVSASIADAIRSTHIPGSTHIQLSSLDDLPPVMASAQTLALVFSNLFENACDALGSTGTILVSGSANMEWVEVTIQDDGPGIPPELHDHIFDLDYSGRLSTRPGKLGFGLWWVKTLMTRLGGSVTVESDGVHGTTFRLCLPRMKQSTSLDSTGS